MSTFVTSALLQLFFCTSFYATDICINDVLPTDILSCILPEAYAHKSAISIQLPSVCKRWHSFFISDVGKKITQETRMYHQNKYRTNGLQLYHCCDGSAWAAFKKDDDRYQEIETLLRHSYANTNHSTLPDNKTPLIAVCSRLASEHHGRIIKLLLAHGANPNQPALKERWLPCSPLSWVAHRAGRCKNQRVLITAINDLLSAGANINGIAPFDAPISFAIQRLNFIKGGWDEESINNIFDVIAFLITHDADLAVTTEGLERTNNPLVDFIGKDKHNRSASTLRLFLQHGANVHQPSNYGSAYSMALYQASLGDSLYLDIMHEYEPPRRFMCVIS